MTSDSEDFFPEPVDVPLEDSFDLHTFTPRDIPSVVESYLEAAIEAGFEEVRIIHGRGKGVQKEVVRRVLTEHPNVTSFREAPSDRGGWGATIAWLKKKDQVG